MSELMARLNMLNQVQMSDEKISAIVSQNRVGKEIELSMNEDGFLYYRDQVCVPNDNELKKSILEETHYESYAIHPGSTKMYKDLKTSYWWSGMKKDVMDFMNECMVC